MPNWCINTLVVSGEGARAFLRENSGALGRKTLTFRASAPCGETCEEQTAAWGTKWDACVERGAGLLAEDSFFGENGTVKCAFDTAWAPPLRWLQAAGAKYPQLCFSLSYWERGCDYRGRMEVIGGKVTLDREAPFAHEATAAEVASFRRTLRLGPLTPRRVCGVVAQVAEGAVGDLRGFCNDLECEEEGPPSEDSLLAGLERVLAAEAQAAARRLQGQSAKDGYLFVPEDRKAATPPEKSRESRESRESRDSGPLAR